MVVVKRNRGTPRLTRPVDTLSELLMVPKRADARRNFEALLATAAEAFATEGTDVPLDEIARRAGVGNATLYRNFPTRRDLIVAVCVGEVEALRDHGARLAASGEPRTALLQWIDRFVEHIAANKGLAAALMTGAGENSAVVDACNAAIGQTAKMLLDNAKASGTIKEDIEVTDLLSLANAIAIVAESDGLIRARRMLQLFFDGAKP